MIVDHSDELTVALFEEAGDALFLFHPDTEQLRDANPMAQRLSGLNRRELLGRKISALFRSESPGGLNRLRQASRKTGVFHSQEGYGLLHEPSGDWVPVNVTVSRLHLTGSTLSLLTARDVRAQRESLRRLSELEAEQHRLLDRVAACLWSGRIRDRQTVVCRYVSAVSVRIAGRPPEFFLNRSDGWGEIVHPDDAEEWQRFVAGLQPGTSDKLECRVVWPDGSVRWVRHTIRVSEDHGPADEPEVRVDGLVTDVTSLRQAEAARRQSEARLSGIVETTTDAVLIIDQSGRITFCNGAAAKIFGTPRESLIGRPYSESAVKVTAVDGRPVSAEAYPVTKVLRGAPTILAEEFAVCRPDGSWIMVAVSATPVPLDDGGHGAVCFLSDITERKRAELALRRRVEEQESLSRVSQFLLQVDTEAVLWEQAPGLIAKLFGFDVVVFNRLSASGEEVVLRGVFGPAGEAGAGHPWPARLPLSQSISAPVHHTGKPLIVADLRTRPEFQDTMAARVGAVSVACFPMIAGTRCLGSIVLAMYSVRRISSSLTSTLQAVADFVAQTMQRLATSAALLASEARFRLLFERNVAGVFRTSLDGTILDCNDAYARIFGYPDRRELLTRSVLDLYFDPADREALIRVLHDRHVLSNFESCLRRRDGSPVFVLLNVNLRVEPDGSGVLEGTLSDISERIRLENQLLQSSKLEAIGQLAGGVAHDFNNLLTAILGNVSLLLMKTPPGDPRRELMTAVDQAAGRARDLTSQLLGFARRAVITPKLIDMRTVVEEVVNLLRRTIDPRIVVRVRVDEVSCTVLADPGQMNQMLMNFCLNARDAMPDGGELVLECECVEVDDEHRRRRVEALPGRFVRLRVKDNGQGMTVETQRRIFEPFFTTKPPGKGSGLGLAMVFGIVKQQQGWIECESDPGTGTCFDTYLPCHDEAPAPEEPEAAQPAGGGTGLVLVVDDDARIRSLAREILVLHGFDVLVAEDGVEATELYREAHDRIDLVILDMTMPQLSGQDTLERLVAISPQVRVLFSSGYLREPMDATPDPAVVGFVSKPYRAQDLVKAVSQAVEAGRDRPRITPQDTP